MSLKSPPNSHGDARACRRIKKHALVNSLNYLNFSGEALSVILVHKRFPKQIRVQANTQPCTSDHLDGSWISLPFPPEKIHNYTFSHLLIRNGRTCITVESEACSLSSSGFCLLLPEDGEEINARKKERHPCIDVKVELTQNGCVFVCQATDFNGESISLKIPQFAKELGRLRTNYDCYLKISTESAVILACPGVISRLELEEQGARLVFDVVKDSIQLFPPQKIRSVRQKLFPSPDIRFFHPLTGKRYSLKVQDISGAGFSVEDEEERSLLIPGLLIPNLEIYFSNSHHISCTVQIVYRSSLVNSNRKRKFGFAIIDISMDHHAELLSIIKNAENHNLYVSNKVDAEELIKFFFETGFIYPQKYATLNKNINQITKTLKAIYENIPSICRHFVCKENNSLVAHIAMVRYFERTWLIQHHAAQHTSLKSSGLFVLEQLCHSIVDSKSLFFSSMTYLTCFFRQENRFPSLIFGGFAKHHGNNRECSLDQFYYLEANIQSDCQSSQKQSPITYDYILQECSSVNLDELNFFYSKESGGLLMEAFQLDNGRTGLSTLIEEYKKSGLTRSRSIYAVQCNETVLGIVVLNNSDLGLNLGNLTNSAMVFLYTSEVDVPHLIRTCEETRKSLGYSEVTYLFFHKNFPSADTKFPARTYDLFAINTLLSDPFIGFINKFCKISRGVKSNGMQ